MNRFPLIEWKYLFFFHPNTSTSTPVQDPSPPVRVNMIEEDHLIIIFSNIDYHRLLFKLPTYVVDYTPASEYPENEHEDVEISDNTIRTLWWYYGNIFYFQPQWLKIKACDYQLSSSVEIWKYYTACCVCLGDQSHWDSRGWMTYHIKHKNNGW